MCKTPTRPEYIRTNQFGFGLLSQRAQRSKKFNLDWNFQSRLKISIEIEIFNPDLQNSPQKLGSGGQRAWNFQSRLKISRSWFFSIFGPLGFACLILLKILRSHGPRSCLFVSRLPTVNEDCPTRRSHRQANAFAMGFLALSDWRMAPVDSHELAWLQQTSGICIRQQGALFNTKLGLPWRNRGVHQH